MTTYEKERGVSTHICNCESRTITVVLQDGFWDDAVTADGRTAREVYLDDICRFVREAANEIHHAVRETRP